VVEVFKLSQQVIMGYGLCEALERVCHTHPTAMMIGTFFILFLTYISHFKKIIFVLTIPSQTLVKIKWFFLGIQ
jgi:hypothetical protein